MVYGREDPLGKCSFGVVPRKGLFPVAPKEEIRATYGNCQKSDVT